MASPSLKAVAFALAWISTASLARAQCLDSSPASECRGHRTGRGARGTDLGAGASLFAGGAFTDVEARPRRTWRTVKPGRRSARASTTTSSSCPTSAFSGRAFAGGGSKRGRALRRADRRLGQVSWTALGSGLDGAVEAILVFDDGSGRPSEASSARPAARPRRRREVGQRVDRGRRRSRRSVALYLRRQPESLCMEGFVQQAAPVEPRRAGPAPWVAVERGSTAPSKRWPFDAQADPCSAGGCGVQAWDGATWSELGAGSRRP
jgi:hypothetical protein